VEWMEYTVSQLNWYLGIQDKIDQLQEMIDSMDEDITCSRMAFTDYGLVIQKDCVFDQVWSRELKRNLYRSGMERLTKDAELFGKVLNNLPSFLKENLCNKKYDKSSLIAFYAELEREKENLDSEKALRRRLEKIEKVEIFKF
jgi:hypothetical protein